MPRPLFGYRVVARAAIIDAPAAAIVAAVLRAPEGRRYRAALRRGETLATAKNRARYIVRHRDQYARGLARRDLEPVPALAIA